jgi:hypothetical protein
VKDAYQILRKPRKGGYTFVTVPELPGFSFMLGPGENDDALNEALEFFLSVKSSN